MREHYGICGWGECCETPVKVGEFSVCARQLKRFRFLCQARTPQNRQQKEWLSAVEDCFCQ